MLTSYLSPQERDEQRFPDLRLLTLGRGHHGINTRWTSWIWSLPTPFDTLEITEASRAIKHYLVVQLQVYSCSAHLRVEFLYVHTQPPASGIFLL